MAALTTLNTLTLGNTFGAWYARTNEVIQRLNLLKTASITGGDGILVKENSALGGFTAEIGDTIAKNVTFQGNLTVLGALNAAFSQNVSGLNVVLPYDSGVTLGNIVYINSSGLLDKAKADDECTAEVIGVVTGFTGSMAQVATSGTVSGSSVVSNFLGSVGATLQKGVVYFLSEGVTGAGTTLEPSVVEYVSRPVLLGLTGDTGLILPYRGFIATYGLSGSSSTTTVPGVSAGVSSVNSLNARVLKVTSGPVTNNINRLRTTGDVFAVTSVNNLSKLTTQSAALTSNIGISKTRFTNSLTIANTFFQSNFSESSSFGDVTQEYFSGRSNSPSTLIYSTSGLTSDVWRIKQIKVTTLKAQKYNSTVEMVRVINRNSVSNYVNYLSVCDGASEVGGTCMLKVGMKAVSIFGTATTNQTNSTLSDFNGILAQHQPYSSGQLAFTPVILTPYKTTYGDVSRPNGDGLTAGVHSSGDASNSFILTKIVPDNSGYHAIIYGDESYTCGDFDYYSNFSQVNRIYVWDVNPTSIGGSNDVLANQYLVSSLEGSDVDVTVPTGATLDTSILGWNATYGSVSESLFINLPIVTAFNNASGEFVSDDYSYNITVSLKKYDLNSRTESDLIVINKDLKSDNILQTNFRGFDISPYIYSNP